MSIYEHDLKKVSTNKYNLINEAYIGKTETLLELEKKIHKLREKITRETSSTCKEVLDINRCIEKQFGMDIFALKLLPTVYADAYTISLGYQYDVARINNLRDYVVGDKTTGYRFRKGNKFCIVTNISYGILKPDNTITDSEVVAILLHEIGHNFGDCLYGDLAFANRKFIEAYRKSLVQDAIMQGILLLPSLGLTGFGLANDIKELNKTDNAKVRAKEKKARHHKSNRVEKFFDSFSRSHAAKKEKKNDDKMMQRSYNSRTSGMYNKDSVNDAYARNYPEDYPTKMQSNIDRQAEVMADRFAEIYGYGLDLITGLNKMSDITSSRDYKYTRRKAHGDSYLLRLNDEYEEAFFNENDYDIHPEHLQRLNSNLASMKREAEKEDIDPKVKKELVDQIKAMEDLVKSMTDASTKIYHIDKLHADYRAYLNDSMPEGIESELNEKIDDILDKKLEELEKKNK